MSTDISIIQKKEVVIDEAYFWKSFMLVSWNVIWALEMNEQLITAWFGQQIQIGFQVKIIPGSLCPSVSYDNKPNIMEFGDIKSSSFFPPE